jgi:hypothetical protein
MFSHRPIPWRVALTLTTVTAWISLEAAALLGQQPSADRWNKGNTHTHTLNSDGDSTPDDVVRWYREHGYQFLALTDHNYLTRVDALNALHGADERFLVIPGEEVTDRFGASSLHINGLGLSRPVEPQGGASVPEVLQRSVDAIRAAGGVSHVNHPNFGWSISADIWDLLLTNGRALYGVAVDDAHTFKQPGNPNVAGPGRGWVMVRAAALDQRALLDAMERGDFYSSTGVVLSDYAATESEIRVAVRATSFARYRIQFIGSGGRLLAEVPEREAVYTLTGSEGYVRARVLESNGLVAWTQPVMVPAR